MRRVFTLMAVVALGACELEEITIVDAEDVVIAEVYVNFVEGPANTEVVAFLHSTADPTLEVVERLLRSEITITRADGFSFGLSNQAETNCLDSRPAGANGACFGSDPSDATRLRPGDLLELTIELDGGGLLEGATRIPGIFELEIDSSVCRLDPDTQMPVRWSNSEGAWAYINETSIRDLPDALRPEGIEVDEDPLYLLGLSISDEDTDILFPAEFGVFNRFDLDTDLAVRLQEGLPAGSSAEIAITAVERNYVNWARGGTFNPSGQVRVPSLRGDGSGVFGGTVGRRFLALADEDAPSGVPDCPVG